MTSGAQKPIEIRSLQKRADFLALRKAKPGSLKVSTNGFLLIGAPATRATPADNSARFGLTVTRKIGHAVCRNHIKRRLRAAILISAPLLAKPGYDYVLIARLAARAMPFEALVADLKRGLAKAPKPTSETKKIGGK